MIEVWEVVNKMVFNYYVNYLTIIDWWHFVIDFSNTIISITIVIIIKHLLLIVNEVILNILKIPLNINDNNTINFHYLDIF